MAPLEVTDARGTEITGDRVALLIGKREQVELSAFSAIPFLGCGPGSDLDEPAFIGHHPSQQLFAHCIYRIEGFRVVLTFLHIHKARIYLSRLPLNDGNRERLLPPVHTPLYSDQFFVQSHL